MTNTQAVVYACEWRYLLETLVNALARSPNQPTKRWYRSKTLDVGY
jgi:hypothetical protein